MSRPQIVGSRDRSDRGGDAVRIRRGLRRPHRPPTTTRRKSAEAFSAKTPKGRFIHFRHPRARHGPRRSTASSCMAAFAPNGATFLIFSDYARPAMRLAALMGTGVGLCDDPWIRSGLARTDRPTSRSSILSRSARFPICAWFRPCDAVEVAECWELAPQPQRRADCAGVDAAEPAAIAQFGARGQSLQPRRL